MIYNLQNEFMDILPYLAFGGMSVMASILILRLPETLHQKLPDTILEAESLGRDVNDESS